jgi:RES domain-containing protein
MHDVSADRARKYGTHRMAARSGHPRLEWYSGEGAYRTGSRWNSHDVRVVGCATDPAAAMLEVAVYKRFLVLGTL